MKTLLATEKQLSFIKSLLERSHLNGFETEKKNVENIARQSLENLTKDEASLILQYLLYTDTVGKFECSIETLFIEEQRVL